MTRVGPVSPVDTLRAQRKEAPFRHLHDEPSPLPTKVTFTQRDLNAHRPPPVEIPAPPQISLQERLDLSRPIPDTSLLLTATMLASLPERSVTLRSYLQAEIRAYTS